MIDDFVAYLKNSIERQYQDYLSNRLATGRVGKEGYEKAIGWLESMKSMQSNLDVFASEFKKLRDKHQ